MGKVNLHDLYINIPTGYAQGTPVGYSQKSIGDILDDQDWFELAMLQEWISQQFLDLIDWDITKESHVGEDMNKVWNQMLPGVKH